MIQTYHHGRFEFFVAMIVIAIVALAAFSRYALIAEDARVLRLELISHHFMTGAANVRTQFLVEKSVGKTSSHQQLNISGQPFYFSDQAWPVSVAGPVTNDYRPTLEDCYQLWMLLLQNPAPISKGAAAKNHYEYRVFIHANNCRYGFSDGTAYFDYLPIDGRLIFIPVVNGRSNIN